MRKEFLLLPPLSWESTLSPPLGAMVTLCRSTQLCAKGWAPWSHSELMGIPGPWCLNYFLLNSADFSINISWIEVKFRNGECVSCRGPVTFYPPLTQDHRCREKGLKSTDPGGPLPEFGSGPALTALGQGTNPRCAPVFSSIKWG